MAQGGIWVMCGCKRKGRGLFPVAEHNLDLQLCSEVWLISPLDTQQSESALLKAQLSLAVLRR